MHKGTLRYIKLIFKTLCFCQIRETSQHAVQQLLNFRSCYTTAASEAKPQPDFRPSPGFSSFWGPCRCLISAASEAQLQQNFSSFWSPVAAWVQQLLKPSCKRISAASEAQSQLEFSSFWSPAATEVQQLLKPSSSKLAEYVGTRTGLPGQLPPEIVPTTGSGVDTLTLSKPS